jgi:hypothetical protein
MIAIGSQTSKLVYVSVLNSSADTILKGGGHLNLRKA